MYLSRVKPSTGFVLSRLAQRAHEGDAYAQHQLLWELFPGREEREFLFRYEQERAGPCYYVLSRIEPDTGLAGVEVSAKPFQPKLRKGDRLAYSLRANPTRMLKAGEPGKRGQRVDVLMHAKHQVRDRADVDMEEIQQQAARDWLMEPQRQERLGLKFMTEPQVTEHCQHQVYKSRARPGRSKPIQFTSVNYQGVLEVVDPERFVTQVAHGIGRAKAMGCGLMLVRRCP